MTTADRPDLAKWRVRHALRSSNAAKGIPMAQHKRPPFGGQTTTERELPMKQIWTVYSVDTSTIDDTFDVLARTWTENGPGDIEFAKVVANYPTSDEAVRGAARLQADYDRIRKMMADSD